jgi:hypothetical protein
MRTLVLMVLALIASLHFLWRTHRPAATRARLLPVNVQLKPEEKP